MIPVEQSEIDRAISEYDAHGATVLRKVVALEWIDRLGPAIDRLMDSGAHGTDMTDGEGRFFGDLFSWLHTSEIKDFVFESGLGELAGAIMRSKEVRFFYDQLLVKEPGTAKRTPWHQDLPYWPVRGEQVISFWVPIDSAGPENGVVTYVKGSHRWNRFFPQQPFLESIREELEQEAAENSNLYDDPFAPRQPRNLADIRDHPEKYDFISYDVEPGDIIVHHPLVIHGAPGNLSRANRRRALALRWFGDDARWEDSRPNFMRSLLRNTDFPYPQLEVGQAITDPVFPVIWKAEAVA